MNQPEEIRRLIKELVPQKEVIEMGEVISIDKHTCRVSLSSGMEHPDVRIRQAIDDSSNHLLMVPKVGASVTMLSLSGDLSDLMVISASEYSSFEYVHDNMEFVIDAEDGKLKFKKGSNSLYGLFDSLSTIIKTLQVGTSQGPSTTPLPTTIQAVNQFEIEFKSILKQS